MFNYNIHFTKTIRDNLPCSLRTSRRINFLKAAVKPFKTLYQEFLDLIDGWFQRARFTFETQYIEKALNLRFDPVNNGIYIQDVVPLRYYIFNEAESEPTQYVFNEWDSAVAYLVGDYSQINGTVYRALTNNTNKAPASNPSDWVVETDLNVYLFNEFDYAYNVRFVVYVPVSVTFDVNEMTALINLYRFASIGYEIQTY
jgi:hypothetical protein